MASIVPIPTTRVGDYFVRQRLIGQVQNDQVTLFNLQTQISTGQRIQLPSDDAPAALRAINLQRLLDRKGQIKSNIQSNNQFLVAADSNLGGISDLLTKIKADTIGVAGTVATDADRETVVNSIAQAIRTLVATGNAKLQDRYLFSGSTSQVQPYQYDGQVVRYSGNEGTLRTYVDLERLFDTNLPGTEVFGGISSQIKGTDLAPHVTEDTYLNSLNRGNGISQNPAITVSINNGISTVSSVVDLSNAATLGDVVKMIESNPPTGTTIRATVTGTGLTLTTPSGTITVGEVAQGKAASELGILTPAGAPSSNTIVGQPLHTAVELTTELSTLLGTKATARIQSANPNNDILLTANNNGAAYNNVRVVFANDGVFGAETASYDASDPLNKVLTVHVQANSTTAAMAVAAINAEGTFSADIDFHDAIKTSQAGTNTVEIRDFGQITAGGSGQVLDTAHGLIVTNGGKTVTLNTSNLKTVEDFLNLLNGSGLGLDAEINANRDGINILSRLSGTDLQIGENGGAMATQLGVRTYTGETKLADLNHGVGVAKQFDATKADFRITARDGTQLDINLSTAKDVQDVIDLINNHAANNTGTTKVVAQLATTGNGIQLLDQSTVSTGNLTVDALEGSQAAQYLGLMSLDQTQVTSNTTNADGDYVMQTEDRYSIETDSVFTTLLRLQKALKANDTGEIGKSIEVLDSDVKRVNYARAEIGSRLQSLEVIGSKLDDENVQLKSALSDDIDVDLAQAISDMTAHQYALQAALQTAASLLQMTLLSYMS
ncbi:MAG: hypothetical protein U0805_18565 [Pirellulales bacterium]